MQRRYPQTRANEKYEVISARALGVRLSPMVIMEPGIFHHPEKECNSTSILCLSTIQSGRREDRFLSVMDQKKQGFVDNPTWYKEAVVYQLHVKSFADSNGDGIGDFAGLTQKLDYLERLGATAIWLLPFYPSPLRDDGYDTADYLSINPMYGTLRHFKKFLKEAHQRGMKVITELVINHTSDQHAWFQKSRAARPGSYWREFYVWSDTPDKYRDARIIFRDFESSNWAWDPVAKAYFWHRFYSHQPDLNFENPRVHDAVAKVIDFWMEMGVDGMRLDAVPYLYEEDGSSCENLPQTYEYLKKLRAHVDARFSDRMLLAEANQWPEDAAAYFGNGDMCHMAFHFPLMPRMFMSLQMEDSFPIIDIMEQTPRIPDNAQWMVFLRNHDELTLEMVTDEERDYMYRFYASDPVSRINLGIRRRLAPLMNNSRRRIELMNIMLFSLPGTPVIYYGDEIGMGDNHYLGDRNGVRTPMQWNGDRNAGFSSANPQRLQLPIIIDPEYHFETVNVETQEHSPSSLMWWMRRVVEMRKRYRAFARGDIEFLASENSSVLAFIRKYEEEVMLVVINLSRFAQAVRLDLSDYAGYVPEDIFSNNQFPSITHNPYVLTMSFHDYFWLELKPVEVTEEQTSEKLLPELYVPTRWSSLFNGRSRAKLESSILPDYLRRRTSAGIRPLPIKSVKIDDTLEIKEDGGTAAVVLLLTVRHSRGAVETIFLPVCYSSEERIRSTTKANAGLIIAKLAGAQHGYIHDGVYHQRFYHAVARIAAGKRRHNGAHGALIGSAERGYKSAISTSWKERIQRLKTGVRNVTVSLGNSICVKSYRRLSEGTNPELEVLGHLRAAPSMKGFIPPLAGEVTYEGKRGTRYTIATLTEYVPHSGDARQQAVISATKFYEAIAALLSESAETEPVFTNLSVEQHPEVNEHVRKRMGIFPSSAELLGRRTGLMHEALMGAPENKPFAPEPYTMLFQRSLFQSLQATIKRAFAGVRRAMKTMDEETLDLAQQGLAREEKLYSIVSVLKQKQYKCSKIRIHGDYALDQLLNLGNDYAVKDFEGHGDLAISERRLKRSPLRDVASLVYSLHDAALVALYERVKISSEGIRDLGPWATEWWMASSSALLGVYYEETARTGLVPVSPTDFLELLRVFLIERASRDLIESATNRPEGIGIGLRALDTYALLDGAG